MVDVFNELDKDKNIISIPRQLSDKVKGKIKDTDFKTISEYTTFMLRLMLYEDTKREKIDEKKIKQRLKALGYI